MAIPISLRLAVRQWLARPLRPVLCSLAISAAVALIICVGAAMDSLRFSVDNAIGKALGVAEVHIRPSQRETDARVSDALLQQIRARPEVELADARAVSLASIGEGDEHRLFDVVGIDPALDETLRPKIFEAGGRLSGRPDEILIDGNIAEIMNLKVDQLVPFSVKDNPSRRLKIVGIVERPRLEILSKPTIYMPLEVLLADLKTPGQYNVIDIKLRESGGIEDFDQYAKDLGKQLGPAYDVSPGTSSKARMADMTRTLRLFLTLLSVLSGFSASLIIGTTLSVGVQERVRQFGQLRCIGASRPQLAAFLLGDAAVMLAIGQTFGIILGIALSFALIKWFPSFFQAFKLSPASLLIAIFCGTFATLLGALIPIWQVTRVPPMAAITAVANRVKPSRVRLAGVVGIGCLILQMIIWFFPTSSREFRVFSYAFVGIPLIFGGWCLLAPLCVILVERLAAPLLGGIFQVRPTLLRNSWSRTPWRAGAMIAALMIGVILFTTIRARGQSLRASWITPQIPDLVAKSPFRGLTNARVERLQRDHPELRDLAPFDYFGVTLKANPAQIGKIMNEEKTTYVAVNPRQFAAMVPMDFAQAAGNDPAIALKQLEDGRHVFVTTEFYNTRKLGVGEVLTIRGSNGKEVNFTIAAVVSSTGVEVVKNYFDLRASFGEKSVSSVLGSISDAKSFFTMGDPTLMLMNVQTDRANPASMTKLRKQLEIEGLQSLSSVEIKHTLNHILDRIINGLSVIGIGALIVASLGVANMVIASIHARRYEFGVLRAIGAGRFQLVRLVIAEVTLISLIAGTLGAGAGLTFCFMACQLDYVLIGFPTSFLDPHLGTAILTAIGLVCLAIAITTLLAWLASIIPAIRGATAAQRTLLAAGRI